MSLKVGTLVNRNFTISRPVRAASKYVFALMVVWFALMGFTDTGGEVSQDVMSRITPADIIGFTLLVSVGISSWRRGVFLLPRVALYGLIFYFWLLVPIPWAREPFRSLTEWFVNIFAFSGFFVTYWYCRQLDFEGRMKLATFWACTSGFIAGLGFYDWMAAFVGLPRIGSGIASAVTGTFRNTGQAGTFFLVSLVVNVPLWTISKGKVRKLIGIICLLIALSLILSLKRAAIIGASFGLILLLGSFLKRRNGLATVLTIVAGLSVLYFAFTWSASNNEGFSARVTRKEAPKADFVEENFASGMRGLDSSPVVGVGLAGIGGEIASYEIHSTYVGVLVYGGTVGFFLYLVFFVTMLRKSRKALNGDPRAIPFAKALFPMMCGLALSWIYTYSPRKREVWPAVGLAFGMLAPLGREVKEVEQEQEEEAETMQPALTD